MLERPFTVYADFECSLCEVDDKPTEIEATETETTETEDTEIKGKKMAIHKANSACFYFVCSFDSSRTKLWHSTGDNCVVDMIKELNSLSQNCIHEMKKILR